MGGACAVLCAASFARLCTGSDVAEWASLPSAYSSLNRCKKTLSVDTVAKTLILFCKVAIVWKINCYCRKKTPPIKYRYMNRYGMCLPVQSCSWPPQGITRYQGYSSNLTLHIKNHNHSSVRDTFSTVPNQTSRGWLWDFPTCSGQQWLKSCTASRKQLYCGCVCPSMVWDPNCISRLTWTMHYWIERISVD